MLVVLPFYAGDKHLAIRLAEWIRELGGVSNHQCLLCVDPRTTPEGVLEPVAEAFGKVTLFYPHEIMDGWPQGPNAMFRCTAWHVSYEVKTPWLFLEPDATPLKSSWLDEIEAGYKACGKPFMGVKVSQPNIPEYMAGVAVYPAQVENYSTTAMLSHDAPWDVNAAIEIVPKAAWTDLIQHEWTVRGENATFPDLLSLALIRPESVLFHRCKDSTLIDRLREQKTFSAPEVPIPETWEQAQKAGWSVGCDMQPKSIMEEFRDKCSTLKTLIDGKPGRYQMLREALREFGLIGKPKKRKRGA